MGTPTPLLGGASSVVSAVVSLSRPAKTLAMSNEKELSDPVTLIEETDTAPAPDAERESFECSREYLTRTCFTMNIYWRTLILFGVVVVYLIIGGAIFTALERPNEQRQNQANIEANETLTRQFNLTVEFLTANSNLSEEAVINLLRNISNLSMAAADITTTDNWVFASSTFFATTVVTTIGYGKTAPVTDGGRGFFIPYAIIGIPITLIFLAELGNLLNKLVKLASRPLGKKAELPWVNGLILLASTIVGLILLVFIPAIIFSAIDGWTYFESIYYVFVTLTTVGFGDFVPNVPESSGFYRMSNSVWLFVGLAFLALLITRVQEMLTNTKERHKKIKKCLKEKIIKRQKHEEDGVGDKNEETS